MDRARDVKKPNSFQLTAGEIVPEARQTPNQLQIVQLAACKTRILVIL
jgi:hypothetical protein